MKSSHDQSHRAGRISIAIAGLGNTGSQLIDLLPGLPALGSVTLIDKDVYGVENLASQKITHRDLGKPKAEVQAARLRKLAPGITVQAIFGNLINVPLAHWRVSLILGCLDSLAARSQLNQAAWWNGVPWIDIGVDPPQLLVRVSAFQPSPDNSCFECGLTAEDYAHLQSRHLCQPAVPTSNPTQGRRDLAALAASLAAIEAAKILCGDTEHSLLGRQLVLDAAHQRHFVSALRRNPACRFSHQILTAPRTQLKAGATVAEALTCIQRCRASSKPALRFPGLVFTRSLHCLRCGTEKPILHVLDRLPTRLRQCVRCGENAMEAVGFKLLDQLDARLARADQQRPLRGLGLRAGDVFVCANDPRLRMCELV